MTISIQDAVLAAVRYELNDPIVAPATDGVYWSNAELLGYYNIGITQIIAALQESLTRTVTLNLAAGVEQAIPTDGVRVLKLPSNIPYAGLKRSGITEASAEAMQDAAPDWYSRPPTKYVRHAIFYPAEVECLRFRVFPPNDGTGQVLLTYAYAPPEAATTSDPFGLTEAYRGAMQNFILAHAWGKNTARGDVAKKNLHMQLFNAAIGLKEAADTRTQPAPASARSSE